MTPFLHFRSWLRSGPTGERVVTAGTAVVLVALVAWASTPSTRGGGDVAPAGALVTDGGPTAPPGAAAPAGTRALGPAGTGTRTMAGTLGAAGPVAPGPVGPAGGTSAGGTGGAAASGPSGATAATAKTCGSPGATDVGVTATTITIGIIVVDLGQASNLIAVPSAEDQRKAHTAVFNDINNKGGVLCRKLVPKFYTDGVFDTSQEHAECLRMQADKVFAVFNNMFNTSEQTCIPKAKIPNIWYTPPHTPDVRKYSPYILSWQPDFDQLIHAYVFGAKAQGYFNGMKKLGILTQTCYPDEFPALKKELSAAGIDPGQASVFDYGCTQSPQSPQSDQAAVLQFKRDGVTHIVNVHYNNDANFSIAADQQNYFPKFAHMEDASATAIETGSTKPGKSFNNTLLISTIQTGAAHTPGYQFNKPTQECTKLLAANGLPSAYSAGVAALFGIACIDGALLKAMAERMPVLRRDQLAKAMTRLGPLDLAYPGGPINVTNAQIPTGGQLARPGVWQSSCDCWKVTDVRFRAY
jgi:hypothetical protein